MRIFDKVLVILINIKPLSANPYYAGCMQANCRLCKYHIKHKLRIIENLSECANV